MSHFVGMQEVFKIEKNVGDGQLGDVSARYKQLFAEDGTEADNAKKQEARKHNYSFIVDTYYNIVTAFYEYGWGQSFHFAPRYHGESFRESMYRHEHYLSSKLGLKQGIKCLDMGCGVGGPMRTIAHFSGAKITGITINQYQVDRARSHNARAGLGNQCNVLQGNFLNLPFSDNTFDAIYAIEATCHAPNKDEAYCEAFRVLKPGGTFGLYEWCMTDKYDPNNSTHRKIKLQIEEGDALPNLDSIAEVLEALKRVGFEIVEYEDRAVTSPVPWYEPLDGKLTFTGFKHSRIGRTMTRMSLAVLETFRIVPRGSAGVAQLLNEAADALVAGGKEGIFTPLFFALIRKPQPSE
eukprot:gene6918-9552_t